MYKERRARRVREKHASLRARRSRVHRRGAHLSLKLPTNCSYDAVPPGHGLLGTGQLDEVGTVRRFDDAGPQPEVRFVVARGRAGRHLRDIRAIHVDERHGESVDRPRLLLRDGARRPAVWLLHLAHPSLDVGVDAAALPAEVVARSAARPRRRRPRAAA